MAYPKEFVKCEVIEETVDLQVLRYNSDQILVVHLRTGACQRIHEALGSGMNYDANYAYTGEEMAMFKRIQGGVPAC